LARRHRLSGYQIFTQSSYFDSHHHLNNKAPGPLQLYLHKDAAMPPPWQMLIIKTNCADARTYTQGPIVFNLYYHLQHATVFTQRLCLPVICLIGQHKVCVLICYLLTYLLSIFANIVAQWETGKMAANNEQMKTKLSCHTEAVWRSVCHWKFCSTTLVYVTGANDSLKEWSIHSNRPVRVVEKWHHRNLH